MNHSMAIRLPGLAERINHWIILSGVIAVAILLRILLLVLNAFPFNSDEAIVALMARHILHGIDFPLFFYGQAYMGSFDAILVALGFGLFGEQVWVIRLVQIILYTGLILTTYFIALNISQTRTLALLASLFMMIPSINITLYTTVSLGGYGEALLIGNLILLCALLIRNEIRNFEFIKPKLSFLFGILIGFGFWVFGLTLVFSISAMIYLGWLVKKTAFYREKTDAFRKILLYIVVGTILGLTPVIFHVLSGGAGAVIRELMGSAIAGAGGDTLIQQITTSLVSFLIIGLTAILGIRPPWEVRWLILPLVPFVLMFWAAAVYFYLKKDSLVRKSLADQGLLLLLVVVLTVSGFVLTPFGADPSGRYFLPLAVPMVILAAAFTWQMYLRWKPWLWILPAFILSFHLLGIFQSALSNPPGITTQFDAVAQVNHAYDQELMDFLNKNNIHTGYSNYWVAYPLAFLSHESLIFVPVLPYHEDFRYTTRDNRYLPYNDMVIVSPKSAYITTKHPDLNQYIREQFTNHQINWSEQSIGDYQIFYDLSEPITPAAIGLGANR
jgi:hypothetical protein